MSRLKPLKKRWERVHASVRQPVVFILGSLFIIAAGLTGWLPGPGGIPLFLIGIAILATEFEWAKRLQDWVIARIHHLGRWFRAHKLVGSLILLLAITLLGSISYAAYTSLH